MSGGRSVDIRQGITREQAAHLTAGDEVALTGPVLTLRDASAARLAETLAQGAAPPTSLTGRVLYAVGPSPASAGRVIGSAGPTTTARMARYLPVLLAAGVGAVIGKGALHGPDAAVFASRGALYFAAIGGAGALLARHITALRSVAYEDLGSEALYELELEALPAVLIIDSAGGNFHELAQAAWRHPRR